MSHISVRKKHFNVDSQHLCGNLIFKKQIFELCKKHIRVWEFIQMNPKMNNLFVFTNGATITKNEVTENNIYEYCILHYLYHIMHYEYHSMQYEYHNMHYDYHIMQCKSHTNISFIDTCIPSMIQKSTQWWWNKRENCGDLTHKFFF